jgi:hypothetical protein
VENIYLPLSVVSFDLPLSVRERERERERVSKRERDSVVERERERVSFRKIVVYKSVYISIKERKRERLYAIREQTPKNPTSKKKKTNFLIW